MQGSIEKIQEPLKTQLRELLDWLFDNGVWFSSRHTYGYNMYEHENENDFIEMNMYKRFFYIGISEPKFYMIHDHLGQHCKRCVDRTDYNSFQEIFDAIKAGF